MPRRRPDPPSVDRVAVILGIPSAQLGATASPPLAGWVPQRRSVEAISLPVAAIEPEPALKCPARDVPALKSPAPDVPAPGLLDIEDNGRHRRPAPPKPAPPKPAILTVPVSLRGVRARPRRLAVLGVMVLLFAAALVFGVRVAWARSSAQAQPVAATAHSPPGGLVSRTLPGAFASAGSAGMPTAAGVLLVHVVGQVRRPGVVRLPPGSRVLDAVKAAGGATALADLNHLNLARVVADGEQIVVPKPGESVGGGAGAGGAATGSAGAGSGGGLIDLNTADAAALDSLPGVGPVLAQRILDWRTEHGRFSSVDELGEVSGIGDKILAQISPKVRV